MAVLVILAVLATWLLLAAVTAVACAALVRGGSRGGYPGPHPAERRSAGDLVAPADSNWL
jgi:hypothetical protein